MNYLIKFFLEGSFETMGLMTISFSLPPFPPLNETKITAIMCGLLLTTHREYKRDK